MALSFSEIVEEARLSARALLDPGPRTAWRAAARASPSSIHPTRVKNRAAAA